MEREISRLNTAIEKVVVPDSLKPDEVAGWGPTRLMFGSHLLWNDLLANGLVDELHLMIGAGVVGEGVRAFETRPPGSLRCWTPAPSTARACSWPGTPSSADRDAAPGRRTRRCT